MPPFRALQDGSVAAADDGSLSLANSTAEPWFPPTTFPLVPETPKEKAADAAALAIVLVVLLAVACVPPACAGRAPALLCWRA